MTTQEDTTFQEALTAIQEGEKKRARDLLTRLIKVNSANPQFWLYMSMVVESHKELIFCLQEALKRDPKNAIARRGLMLQGELPPDPQFVIPAQLQRRNWESQYFAGQPVPGAAVGQPSRLRLGLILGGVAALIVVIGIVVMGAANRQEAPAFISWLQRYTPAPTSSDLPVTPSVAISAVIPSPVGGTPGDNLVTSTPAPLYINTPHPRTESYRSAINAFQRGDWTAALNFLQQAIKEDPKADLYYLQGECNRSLKKFKEALVAFEQAITLDPRFAPPYLGRARIRMQTSPDLLDAIRADLDKAIGLDPNLLDAYLELASFKASHKDPSGALRDLETAMRLQPTSAQPYAFRARTYLALNQPDLAVSDARRANQMDPGNLSFYRLLAESLRANNDLAACVSALTTYTRYVSDDAEALAWLGQTFAALSDLSNAQRYLDLALAVNDRSFETRIIRAFVFIDFKDARKALDELRAASVLRPEAYLVSLGLGRAALITNDISEAWRNFSVALTLAQTDTEKAQAYYWRAIALETAQQLPQALADWNDMFRLPTSAIPAGLRDSALQHLQALYTATPTLRIATTTITPTATRSASQTATPSSTSTATPTTTPTPTVRATATASATATVRATATATVTATATFTPTTSKTP